MTKQLDTDTATSGTAHFHNGTKVGDYAENQHSIQQHNHRYSGTPAIVYSTQQIYKRNVIIAEVSRK